VLGGRRVAQKEIADSIPDYKGNAVLSESHQSRSVPRGGAMTNTSQSQWQALTQRTRESLRLCSNDNRKQSAVAPKAAEKMADERGTLKIFNDLIGTRALDLLA
jgi:hypothetical protein